MENEKNGPQALALVGLFLVTACFQPDFNHPLDPVQPAGLIASMMLSKTGGSSDGMNGLFLFITSSSFTGNIGSIAGADSQCNADSARPRATSYKAMLVNVAGGRRASQSPEIGDGQIDWVLRPSTRYFRSDGAFLVTTSVEGLIKSELQAPMDSSGSRKYWTAIDSNWTTHVNDCSGWTDGAVGPSGAYGLGSSVTSGAIASGSQGCEQLAHLLCVEQ